MSLPNVLSTRLTQVLACPMDHTGLRIKEDCLVCVHGHTFMIENGVPVFTDAVRREAFPKNMATCRQDRQRGSTIDPFVNDWLVNTNGNLYWPARGKLLRYPIPHWPHSLGSGQIALDVGCSWGRWSIAAARAGFVSIGMDVHLDALTAAQRVSRDLGVQADFVCADVEKIPFQSKSIDIIFSYSVLQHLDRAKVVHFFQEVSRLLRPQGICFVQLPNTFGVYNMLLQARRGFRDARPGTFEMRYWSRQKIRQIIESAGLRDMRISADGFFTQNPQESDLDLLSPAARLIVRASLAGRRTANVLPMLTYFADSLWVQATAPAMSG